MKQGRKHYDDRDFNFVLVQYLIVSRHEAARIFEEYRLTAQHTDPPTRVHSHRGQYRFMSDFEATFIEEGGGGDETGRK